MSDVQTLKQLGFKYLTDVYIDETGLLQINQKDIYNQVYQIFIDSRLIYIGKTKRWKKRWDTYRNVINWKSGNLQNIKKTQLLTEALKQGKKVKVYYKHAIFNSKFKDFENKDLEVSSLLEEERRFINKFKPKWNIHHA